eukprot:gene3514-3784_t
MSSRFSSESGDSQSDFSSVGGDSVIGGADTQQLDLNNRNDEELADLVDDSRTVEDAVFASMYILSANRNSTDVKWTVARILLDFLQGISWILFRQVVAPKGYQTYITVFYILVAAVLLSLVLTVWAAIVLKRNEAASIWMRRLQSALQIVGLVLFSMFWVAVLDYFAFMFTCQWSHVASGAAYHLYFKEQNCMAMPHVAYMISCLVMLVLFSCAAVCMTLTDCDLNPLTRNHLASPMPVTGVKALVLRILMVLLSTCLAEIGRAQSVLMLICAVYITYCLITTVPYFNEKVNYAYVGLWSAIVLSCTILVAMDFTLGSFKEGEEQLQFRRTMTSVVLYAVFPVVIAGGLISWQYGRLCRKPLERLKQAFEGGDTDLVLKDVHRFKNAFEAEYLLRVMRKWDIDGVPDPETTAFGEFILKCAMARLPNNAYLMTLYSNFIVEVRKDGSAARTQLQLAAKAGPNMLDRYFIYISQEVVKKIKTDNGMDLLGYVEFQRAYRACVKVHRLALQAQRQFWHSMLRDTVAYRDLQGSLDLMDRSSQTASEMYKRVMERYPANGKLLKVYGRFLEYVMDDPWGKPSNTRESGRVAERESQREREWEWERERERESGGKEGEWEGEW